MPCRSPDFSVEMFLQAGLRVAGMPDVILAGVVRPQDVAVEGPRSSAGTLGSHSGSTQFDIGHLTWPGTTRTRLDRDPVACQTETRSELDPASRQLYCTAPDFRVLGQVCRVVTRVFEAAGFTD